MEETQFNGSSQHERPDHDDDSPQPGDYVDGPREQDVASTRDRKWHTRDQNIFYSTLIEKAAASIGQNDTPAIKRAAERIVDIIMRDRRGVFVRKQSVGWEVMDRKRSIVKAQGAIRNWQVKDSVGGWKSRKRKKQPRTGTASGICKKKPPGHARRAGPPKRHRTFIRYQAQAGAGTSIHPYALLLISTVCNHPRPEDVLNILKGALSEHFKEGEPPKQREIRLQLRHRYAGALASGVEPIFFSERLLEVWGGSLVKSEDSNTSIMMNTGEGEVKQSEEIESQHAELADEVREGLSDRSTTNVSKYGNHESSPVELSMRIGGRQTAPTAEE